jgi:hypothetical protein
MPQSAVSGKQMWIAAVLVFVCFLIALSLSIAGWFEQFTSAELFAMGSFLSAAGFVTLYGVSHAFRGFLKARSLKAATLGQTLRFYGILALFKAYQHVLPPVFAIPTGVMDVAFAISSFYVARRLVGKDGRAASGFVLWHVLGLCALGISAALAILTSPEIAVLVRDGLTSQAMTRFPISLVPVFIGPMVLIFHLLALAAVWENRLKQVLER